MKFEDFNLGSEFSQDTINVYRDFYREIWEENEYERFGVEIPSEGVVVDCGGSIGLFARYAISRGAEKVYTFEVQEKLYPLLEINVKGESRIIPTRGFVTYSDEENGQGCENWSIQRIMENFQLETIDFLKIDIEGGEFDLIRDMSQETLSRVKNISMEVHVWEMFSSIKNTNLAAHNAKKFLEMIEKLSICGFRVSVQKIHSNTCLYMMYASR
jgi:hypothetical protein